MGVYISNDIPEGFKFDEHMLYVGQTIDDNQYVHSKFMAERLIYDAVLHNELNAKVMRVGNLAPRDSDGKFQINYETNNFMATLAAYYDLGMVPYEAMSAISEFGAALQKALADPAKLDKMRPFVAYASNASVRKALGPDDLNVDYTVQVLYRLGFRWMETSENYVRKFLCELDGLGFFN